MAGTEKVCCVYCHKNVVNKQIVCVTTGDTYHESCAKRCKVNADWASSESSEDPGHPKTETQSACGMEVDLLRQILLTKDNTIQDKDMIISTQNQLIKQLYINMNKLELEIVKLTSFCAEGKKKAGQDQAKEQAPKIFKRQSAKNLKEQQREVAGEEIECEMELRTQTLSGITNSGSVEVGKDGTAGQQLVSSEDDFKPVVSRKRVVKKRKQEGLNTIVGTARNESGLELRAAERSGWLYVGRARSDTSAGSLKCYIEGKFPGKNFAVEEIPKHENNTSKNKSFKLGFEIGLLEEIMSPNIWPEGLLVRRYKFFREQGKYQ